MVIAAAGESLSGTSLFVTIVLLAGLVAAGLFLASPLSARLRRARRRPKSAPPWSTSAPNRRPHGGDETSAAEPWSTSSGRTGSNESAGLQDGR